MGKFKIPNILVLFLLLLVLSTFTTHTKAVTLDELLESGKKLLENKPTPKNHLSEPKIEVTTDIQLTENGDVNKNGEMDGGDIVRFSFVVVNGTDKPYPFSKLKTNIKRDSINFIHNLSGVTGLDNSTLELPNIFILPHSKMEIGFDARLNYFDVKLKTEDEISSQGILEDNKKQILAKSLKKAQKINATAKDKIKTLLDNKETGTSQTEELPTSQLKPENIATESTQEETGENNGD